MNNPHIKALVYKIEHDIGIDYRDAKSTFHDEEMFSVQVADNRVRFELKQHYSTIEAAANSEYILNFIRAWEIDAQLRRKSECFRLVLDKSRCEVIDRNPTAGPSTIHIYATAGSPTISANLIVRAQNYPQPVSGLKVTPDVESIFRRYTQYRKGSEPLPSMAYFCLTVFEDSTIGYCDGNKRKCASKMYRISKKVLKKFANLTSNKGGYLARKADGRESDLTITDSEFLEDVVTVMIRRMAKIGNPKFEQFPLVNLSNLSSIANPSSSA